MASSSSSSSSTRAESSTYDVFISFRGEDTRNTFTSFLYRALKERGINVFIDSKNLWTGESIGPTLLEAIQGSKISIPIFSERYADSKWCLTELSQIIECHRSNGQLVIPIFFHVDPSDVRNQKKGSFEEAFLKHEKKFESHIVKGWRDALKEAGNLKGEVVDGTTVQAELVDLVVERISGVLNSNTHLDVCKYPIGIESPVNDMLLLLDFSSTDVHFVGICGFGGIGKTTIAKAVYNRFISTFKKHCFISDIREQATSSMGLVSLQKRLLKDILRTNIDIPDYHRGKRMIEQRLCKEKVFVVLDDVDSKEQVNALAGETNWFGQGSKVIITTRDEEILNKANVDEDKIYRPQVLNHDQSRQLFSLHAFSRDLPPDDYMQLSNDVASYSGGLPLTLEVLGSLLSGITSIEEWEETLQYLKEIPPEEVQKKLRISYDKLDHYQKEIFLDVACHFIGWEEKRVTPIWEACGYRPRCAIPILIKRSLIKFEDKFGILILKMHDQIRDMGRGIVLEENRTDPSKRSRLWSDDDILQVLENNKGINTMKCMVFSRRFVDVYLDERHFDMMPNLKFLYISQENVNGNFGRLPSTLRCFAWEYCHWDIIPTNFYHKGLVHLKLKGERIQQAWNIGPPDENKFQKLKVLDLRYCQSLSKSPNFSWFPYLEQLVLSCCSGLEILDESIGQLSQLKNLDLEYCHQIMELPNSIGNLKSLVKLNLSNTGIKELPDTICMLSSLKNLELTMCLSLTRLPDFMGSLKNLVELNLTDSMGVEELPDSVGLLENLEVLSASSWCRLVKLPRSMGRMRYLHTLNLIGANISKLPDDFSMLSNLEVLKMSGNLKSFPIDLIHLKKLRILELDNCKRLKELPGVSSSLVRLTCGRCSSLKRILDISRLKHLKELMLLDCQKLKEIRGLEGPESLKNVEVAECPKMTDAKRNIHGQGTLLLPASLHPASLQEKGYRLYGSSKGIILCLVFRFKDCSWIKEGQPHDVNFEIVATIHQKDNATKCRHMVRFKDVEFTSRRDTICLHHFKGFDWFGIPLHGKDSIVIHRVIIYGRSSSTNMNLTFSFMELLFEDREADNQKPINPYWSAQRVADFFSWYHRPTEIVEEDDDDDDDGGGYRSTEEEDDDDWYRSTEEEEEDGDEEWNNTARCFQNCIQFSYSDYDYVEETSRPSKRPQIHVNNDDEEASVSPLDQITVGANGSNCQTHNEDKALIILDNQEADEAAVVDSGHHHSSTTFLKLICFPFTLLFSPCILRWGGGGRSRRGEVR